MPSVRFDGVDDGLSLSAGFEDLRAGVSMFVVARAAGLQSGFKLVALGNGAGQQNVVLGRAGNTAGLQYFTTSRSMVPMGWFNTGGGLVTGEALLLGVVQGAGSVGSSVSASVSVNGGRWDGQW